MSEHCKSCLIFVGAILLAGCIVTPYAQDKGQFDEGYISFIQVGKTSKEDVLAVVGNPARRAKSDNVWLYDSVGTKSWFMGAVYGDAGTVTVTVPEFLIFRWNSSGIVEDYDVIRVEGSCNDDICVGRLDSGSYDFDYYMVYHSREQDSHVKQFNTDAGSCTTYFYVTAPFFADFLPGTTLSRVRVISNGRHISDLVKQNGFLYWKSPGGDQVLNIANDRSFSYTCEAGEIVFIEYEIDSDGESAIEIVDDSVGRKNIEGRRLVMDMSKGLLENRSDPTGQYPH